MSSVRVDACRRISASSPALIEESLTVADDSASDVGEASRGDGEEGGTDGTYVGTNIGTNEEH